MRVLEPQHLSRPNARKKHSAPKKKTVRNTLLVVVLIGGYLLFGQNVDNTPVANTSTQGQHLAAVSSEQPRLKQFTAEEFKAAYNSYIYPNTEPIMSVPRITGNDQADARIRRLAVKRGYKLTSVPVSSIVKTEEAGLEGDDLIQPNALLAWQNLRDQAASAGVKLKLTSAYRSIDYQRTLFLKRMQAAGVNVERVLEGYADDELDAIMSRAAVPGYSRHHTGYTIDLSCNGIGLEAFINTDCYKWLSHNNFENVKKYGWVPSYPEGVGGQGPEPESWEYVWVGTRSTYE